MNGLMLLMAFLIFLSSFQHDSKNNLTNREKKLGQGFGQFFFFLSMKTQHIGQNVFKWLNEIIKLLTLYLQFL